MVSGSAKSTILQKSYLPKNPVCLKTPGWPGENPICQKLYELKEQSAENIKKKRYAIYLKHCDPCCTNSSSRVPQDATRLLREPSDTFEEDGEAYGSFFCTMLLRIVEGTIDSSWAVLERTFHRCVGRFVLGAMPLTMPVRSIYGVMYLCIYGFCKVKISNFKNEKMEEWVVGQKRKLAVKQGGLYI